jgi:hypothetical protein
MGNNRGGWRVDQGEIGEGGEETNKIVYGEKGRN